MQQTTCGEIHNHTKFIKKDDTRRDLLGAIDKLLAHVEKIKDKNVLSQNGFIKQGFVQSLIVDNIDDYFVETFLKPILIKESIELEKLYPKSGDFFIKMIYHILSENRIDEAVTKLQLESSRMRSGEHRKFNLNDIGVLTEDYSETASGIIEKVLELGSARLSVEKSDRIESVILCKNETSFKIRSFFPELWKRDNPYLILIDGIVESISEIHHALEFSADDRKPLAIVARGFSTEVLKTVNLNNARGSIDVCLIHTGFDEKTINIFSDLKACTGLDVISADKGDVISVCVRRGIESITQISADFNSCSFYERNRELDISKQIEYLLMRQKEFKHGDLVDFYSDRILSLSAQSTRVLVGSEDRKYNPGIVGELDEFFRFFVRVSRTGIFEADNSLLGRKVFPNGFLENLFKRCTSLFSCLLSLSGAIILEKES